MKAKAKKHKVNIIAVVSRRAGDMLLYHYKALQIMLVVTGAIISGVIVGWALFLDVQTDTGVLVSETRVRLEIDTIDELEVLLEDRNTTYENPPVVPPSAFGL